VSGASKLLMLSTLGAVSVSPDLFGGDAGQARLDFDTDWGRDAANRTRGYASIRPAGSGWPCVLDATFDAQTLPSYGRTLLPAAPTAFARHSWSSAHEQESALVADRGLRVRNRSLAAHKPHSPRELPSAFSQSSRARERSPYASRVARAAHAARLVSSGSMDTIDCSYSRARFTSPSLADARHPAVQAILRGYPSSPRVTGCGRESQSAKIH
jgi:hypothetical protein